MRAAEERDTHPLAVSQEGGECEDGRVRAGAGGAVVVEDDVESKTRVFVECVVECVYKIVVCDVKRREKDAIFCILYHAL